MEQHPIPRQITTFEFKLIGFMTLKQFLYLVIFGPLGYIVYVIFPIPLINVLLGFATAAFGAALAFVPINDRPLDVWIKNAWKRFNSPTQYTYHKHNPPISFFQNLYYVSDPHHVMAHIESQQMLSSYLAKTKQTMQANVRKQQVQRAFNDIPPVVTPVATPALQQAPPIAASPISDPITQVVSPQTVAPPPVSVPHQPFFVGTVKNGRKIPLPGILIYVKDAQNTPVRLLKTNQYGVFATFNPLPVDSYTFEIKDPKNTYFFDTMKIAIQNSNEHPFEFYSKELL